MKNNCLFIAPHNDDETLFGGIIIQRYKPDVLVLTDSYIQEERGDKITALMRRLESMGAMNVLGAKLMFGGAKDTTLSKEDIEFILRDVTYQYPMIFVPLYEEGGNPQHNLISEVVTEMFPESVVYYGTYIKDRPYPIGEVEIRPTADERAKRNIALDFYQSQINHPYTAPYFQEMRTRSEYLTFKHA